MSRYRFCAIQKSSIALLLVVAMLLSTVQAAALPYGLNEKQSFSPEMAEASGTPMAELTAPTAESPPRDLDTLLSLDGINYAEDGSPVSIRGTARLTTEEIVRILLGEDATARTRQSNAEDDLDALELEYLKETYKIQAEDITRGAELHGSLNQFKGELLILSNIILERSMRQEESEALTKLICSGYTCTQAMTAYVVGCISNLSVDTLCAAKSEEIRAERAREESGATLPEYDDTTWERATRMGIPAALAYTLDTEMLAILESEFGRQWETFYAPEYSDPVYALSQTPEVEGTEQDKDMYARSPSSRVDPDKGIYSLSPTPSLFPNIAPYANGNNYTPEGILEKPFSYDSAEQIDINLNTGAAFYRETNLELPGRNGLDLNFGLVFNSDASWASVPAGFMDDAYANKVVITVAYQCYLWQNYNQNPQGIPELQLITDISGYTFSEDELNVLVSDKRYYTGSQYEEAAAYRDRLNDGGYVIAAATAPNGQSCIIQLNAAIEPLANFSYAFYNYGRGNQYLPNEFGLGHGWRLGFSGIERYMAGFDGFMKQRLITADGKRYEIEFTGQSGDSNLSDYPLADLRLESMGDGYPGATYTLYHTDGTKEYFDSNGRNIAIVNRFGDAITLAYTMEPGNGGVVASIQINDSLGNQLVYRNEHANLDTIQYLPGKENVYNCRYNVVWSLTLNGEVIQTYYSLDRILNSVSTRTLVGATNAAGELTLYTQNSTDHLFNAYISTPSTNDQRAKHLYLAAVTYPNGKGLSLTSESTSNTRRRLGIAGYQTGYAVKQIALRPNPDGERSGSRDYKYGDFSNYKTPYASSYRYTTAITDYNHKKVPGARVGWQTQSVQTIFDAEHQKIQADTMLYPPVLAADINSVEDWKRLFLVENPRLYTKTAYQYNADSLPISISTSYYDRGSSAPGVQKTELYTYDNFGNILTHTQPNGLVYTYTYSEQYALPLTETHQQNAAMTVVTANTLTADGKNIAATATTVNGTMAERATYSYDHYGRVIGQTSYTSENESAETAYVYGTAAAPTEVKLLGVRDADGNLVAGSPGYPAGVIVQKVGYNSRGWATSQTSANGQLTALSYDAAGRITRVTNPDGTSAEYTYDVGGNTVVYTDERGSSLRYRYDPRGGLIEIFDFAADRTTYSASYDTMNRLEMERHYTTEGADRFTYYLYDGLGRLLDKTVNNQAGSILQQETYQYFDGSGKTTKTVVGDTNAPSVVSNTYLDNMGNVVKTGRMLGGNELLDTYAYDYVGNCIQTKRAYTSEQNGAFTTQTAYDHRGRPVSESNALGQTSSFGYDWLGRVRTATDYSGNTTHNTYDTIGRLLEEKTPFIAGAAPVHSIRRYTYDAVGNLTKSQTSSQQPGQPESYSTAEYQYNNRNWLTLAKLGLGDEASFTQYWHDAAGNVLRMYTGQSAPLTISGLDMVSGGNDYQVTKYAYTPQGQLASETNPLNQTEHYTYDLAGAMLSKTARNGAVTLYQYDPLGRMSSATATAVITTSQAYSYTKTGQLLSQSSGADSTTFQYDSLGRLLTETAGGTIKSYSYNAGDLRTQFQLQTGGAPQLSNSYSYDSLGRLTQVSGSGVSASYGYDANGNQSHVQYGNGLREEFSYNAANLVTGLTDKNGGTVLSSYAYGYQLDGNQVSKSDHTGRVTGYTYDSLGRLSSEVEQQNAATRHSYSYQYDRRNNRTGVSYTGVDGNATTSYQYNGANHLLTESQTKGATTATTTYGYDSSGNTTSIRRVETGGAIPLDRTAIYGYDGFGRQISMHDGTATVSYQYRADGLRQSKTVGGATTHYVYDGNQLVLETAGSATTRYLRGHNLVASVGAATSYYLYNAHGDVVQRTDAAGAVLQSYDYDAFGAQRGADPSDTNPFRYSGEYWDGETGTYYLRARNYSPATGRFLTEDPHWSPRNMVYGDNPAKWNERKGNDPLGLNTYTYVPDATAIMQSGNLYGYCMNNPIMYSDPSGNSAAAWWGSTTWWLTIADGPLPIGDIIYGGGLVVLGIADIYLAAKVGEAIADAADNKAPNTGDTQAQPQSGNPGTTGEPNSSADIKNKDGETIGRRYYGPDGKAQKDVDFTDHGNPTRHPEVPHEHTWEWPANGGPPIRNK